MDKYIELNTFLKVMKLATSGGEAKYIIRSGAVMVDGIVETRNRRKLLAGCVVSYGNKKYVVSDLIVR